MHELVRTVAAKWDKDRYMKPDIDAVQDLVCRGRIWSAALPHLKECDAHKNF